MLLSAPYRTVAPSTLLQYYHLVSTSRRLAYVRALDIRSTAKRALPLRSLVWIRRLQTVSTCSMYSQYLHSTAGNECVLNILYLLTYYVVSSLPGTPRTAKGAF